MAKRLKAFKIEPIDPPDKALFLRRLSEDFSVEKAIQISQELRKTYAKYLSLRSFGEMENAILAYDIARNLLTANKQIVGAIAFHYSELLEIVFIDHTGTLMAPKGTGAELVRTVIDAAYRSGVGISLESTPKAMGFWLRLGFKRNKKFHYIFEADLKRVELIKEALGSVGRIKDKEKLE